MQDPQTPDPIMLTFLRIESERIASLCTACGNCVRACPMTAYAPGLKQADAVQTVRGVRDLLLGGAASPQALSWVTVCSRSGVCTDACREEGIDPAYMMRLAKLRALGALGEPPRIAVKEDPQLSAKVKAFARLTMTAEEQAKWL